MVTKRERRLRTLDSLLAKAGRSRQDLARKLGHPSTTFSGWVRETHPAPTDLWARIAAELGVSDDVFDLDETSKPSRTGGGT